MRGYPDLNYPEFNRLAGIIRSKGFRCLNPAEYPVNETWTQADYLRRDLIALLQFCDAIAVMKGWQDSWGAKLEVHVARELGYPILDAYTLDIHEESILQEAERIINGQRQREYGHPLDDFGKVTGMINSLFADKIKDPFVADDWPLMMNCVKMSREVNHPQRDNMTDGAGYWGTLEKIKRERARRQFLDNAKGS